MISQSILFYWSKGADTRRRILSVMDAMNKNEEPCFINKLSESLGLSHVAIKKHVELLLEESYIAQVNPSGKPIYLVLTEMGKKVLKEIEKK